MTQFDVQTEMVRMLREMAQPIVLTPAARPFEMDRLTRAAERLERDEKERHG